MKKLKNGNFVYLNSCKESETKALCVYYQTRAGRATHLCQILRERKGETDLVKRLYEEANNLEIKSLLQLGKFEAIKRLQDEKEN